jgi:Cu-Zn family superoxide dismutase
MRTIAVASLATLTLSACALMPGSGPVAEAQLQPASGSSVSGQVRFAQAGGTVVVSGEIRGLRPNAEHGFHVHEKGDCAGGDGMATGGHFNPGGKAHGHPMRGDHHAGDLPALQADASGVARFRFESTSIAVGSGPADVTGRGLIVHQNPDDYRTQPTGNAGGRIACAVIRRT